MIILLFALVGGGVGAVLLLGGDDEDGGGNEDASATTYATNSPQATVQAVWTALGDHQLDCEAATPFVTERFPLEAECTDHSHRELGAMRVVSQSDTTANVEVQVRVGDHSAQLTLIWELVRDDGVWKVDDIH